MASSKALTISQALEQMKRFCAYQERCIAEVRQRLYKDGFKGDEAEWAIAELISEGYLNEERFARTFARGKFRINKWGRIKIEIELRRRAVSPGNIRRGLSEISDSAYENCLRDFIKKLGATEASDKAKLKIKRSLMQRGFEPELIIRFMKIQSEEEF
ncbi:MAG: regulatory protein RecX [Bacteroidia bacterium]